MITTIFFDLGGVLLTNGWDRDARQRACRQFGLDWDDFQDRHEQVVDDFETAKMSLEAYLEHTVFFEPRAFGPDEVRAFMFAQSQEVPAALAVARELRDGGRYRLGVINNESLELNRYRIDRFHLGDCFGLFFSSCFVGLRKPDPAIYRVALDVTHVAAGSALFVDDRAINVEAAKRVGIHTIHYRSVEHLRACLAQFGVNTGGSP